MFLFFIIEKRRTGNNPAFERTGTSCFNHDLVIHKFQSSLLEKGVKIPLSSDLIFSNFSASKPSASFHSLNKQKLVKIFAIWLVKNYSSHVIVKNTVNKDGGSN